jgi:(p)ppGpp synthase/HD superfamily hydrolase
MQDLKPVLARAIQLAVSYHGLDMGKDGQPYILHPLRVMLNARTDEERIVAVLHDVLEDTHCTAAHLKTVGVPERLVDAVLTLTKRRDEHYSDFIERISQNPLATRVKLLDLQDNMDLLRLQDLDEVDLARATKYFLAVRRLEQPPKRSRHRPQGANPPTHYMSQLRHDKG